MFDLIAFDADDTLWDNNFIYLTAEEKFKHILEKYQLPDALDPLIQATESRNLPLYGYGVKSFVLSLLETAIQATNEHISTADIRTILGFAREMLSTEVQLLNNVESTLQQLAGSHRLILITKGDLSHQQIKIDQSGLRSYFHEIHVVAEKTTDSYGEILKKHRIAPERFLMVGDSMRSDILPVLELGGCAIYVPNDLTWVHEKQPPPQGLEGRYHEVAHLGLLPELLKQIETQP
jgi:putative hydrolase of the HAD superfamily